MKSILEEAADYPWKNWTIEKRTMKNNKIGLIWNNDYMFAKKNEDMKMTYHRQKSHMQWINFSPEIGKAHTGSSGVVVLAKGLAKWWARNPWYDSVEGEVLMSGMKWLQWLVVFHSLVIFKNKSTNRALPDLQLSGEILQGFNYHSNTTTA